MKKHILATALMPLLLAGCSDSSSSKDLKTGDFETNYTATALSETKIILEAEYLAGRNIGTPSIRLSGSDTVTAVLGDVSKELTVDRSGFDYSYVATFSDLATTSAQEITVTLNRNEETIVDVITMPEAFVINAPDKDETFDISNNDALTVTWDPTSDTGTMAVSFDMDCGDNGVLESSESLDGDPGFYTVNLATLLQSLLDDTEVDQETLQCDVDITVKRTLSSNVNELYFDGKIKGVQKRSVAVLFVP